MKSSFAQKKTFFKMLQKHSGGMTGYARSRRRRRLHKPAQQDVFGPNVCVDDSAVMKGADLGRTLQKWRGGDAQGSDGREQLMSDFED